MSVPRPGHPLGGHPAGGLHDAEYPALTALQLTSLKENLECLPSKNRQLSRLPAPM